MKHISLIIIPCILVFLPAWRSGEPSIRDKHRVNFYGKLKTRHTKKTIPVDNISIERKYNQIRVKEKPDKHPKPDVIWSYQKEAHYGKRKFIEIVVISKGKRKTKARYLIERKARLYCDEINEAGAQEKVVQLPALDYITIEGYAFREPQKQVPAQKKPIEIKEKPAPAA